jgi:hypothetical protein
MYRSREVHEVRHANGIPGEASVTMFVLMLRYADDGVDGAFAE